MGVAWLLVALVGQLNGNDTLEAVRFSGNHAFSAKVLQQVVMSKARKPTSDAQLARDADALEAFYRDEGFFAAQAEFSVSRGKKRWVASFQVEEGRRTRVVAVSLAGDSAYGPGRLQPLVAVRPGQFMRQAAVEQSRQALRAFYANSGYPFVDIGAEVTHSDTLATVNFTVSEGPLCYISALTVRGNRTVRPATVLRASEIRPGERFSQQRLYDAQRRLYATKLFYRVAFYLSRPDSLADSLGVRFDVTEQAYRSFGVGAGGETPPNRLLFSLDWEHDNLFNLNHGFVVSTEYSPAFNGDYRVGADVTYGVPYVFQQRINFQTRPFFSYELVDTSLLRELGIETGLTRNVAPQLNAILSNRVRLVADTAQGITNSVALTVQYDTRNDPFDPASGLSVQAVGEVAGGLLGGDNDFRRLTCDARVFRSLGLGFVLAVRALAGRVWPYGQMVAVPYYESFTLGGRSSLRGYAEKSLGPDSAYGGHYGPAAVNGNVELRTPYALNLAGLAGFFDVGTVGRDLRLFAYEYSAGVGLRVKTPIGPVRLDWGKRLKNPVPGDKGQFYLGILNAF